MKETNNNLDTINKSLDELKEKKNSNPRLI